MELDNKIRKEIEKYIIENYLTVEEYSHYDDSDSYTDFNTSMYNFIMYPIKKGDFFNNKPIEVDDVTTWQEDLKNYMEEKGLSSVEVYQNRVSKQTFWKILNDPDFEPSKDTVISLCLSLELNLEETNNLLKKAGFSLSPSKERDLIVQYLIKNKIYDVCVVNGWLESFGFKPLKGSLT